MGARLRFFQFDIPWSTVHGPDNARGFPLPPECDGWEPFQAEIRSSFKDGYIIVAVWLKEAA